MSKLKVLDLFSGIGGFSLGLERTGGFETVAFCEIEEFPRKVLAQHWPEVPCFADVRKLKGSDLNGPVDVICGGYPCQPFSTAGKRRGQEDDRHLWPEFNRLVDELRPAWVIGENVAGHISMGLDNVLSDLEGQGYTCRTFVIPACAVGAYHRRDRTWTVANSGDVLQPFGLGPGASANTTEGGEGSNKRKGKASEWKRLRAQPCAGSQVLADASGERQQGQGQSKQPVGSAAQDDREAGFSRSKRVYAKWIPEPLLGRVANGVPDGMDRLKALGNAVVPQIPELIGRAILEAAQ